MSPIEMLEALHKAWIEFEITAVNRYPHGFPIKASITTDYDTYSFEGESVSEAILKLYAKSKELGVL